MNWKTKLLIDQMASGEKLSKNFYIRDVLDVAPALIGKNMVVRFSDMTYRNFMVNEVEAYRGSEDKACHACRGRTSRTEMMFHEGGNVYVYLIYGVYWMLNIVTGKENDPQAVLIRGAGNHNGPGKIARAIGIDKTFYGEDLNTSDRIWFEDIGVRPVVKTGSRIGIDYAGEYWKTRPWRYYI